MTTIGFDVWINNNYFAYVLLDKDESMETLEKQFPAFMEKYMGKEFAAMDAFRSYPYPFTDIYFERASAFDNVKHGDKTVVYIFLSIAMLILLIACINFMNLSTIRAVERSKEVGLRKVMGALSNHLIWQFIGESIWLTSDFLCIFGWSIAIVHAFYNSLLGYSLTVTWNTWPIYGFFGSYHNCGGFSRQLSGIFSFCIFSHRIIKRQIQTG